jgi:hypothetical protein
MKKTVCSIVCLLFLFNCLVHAQDTVQSPTLKNEISVSSSKLTLDDLSLKYARSISNDLWLKVGVINLEGSFHKNIPSVGSFITKDSQFNGGLLIGIEKQKSINKLEFNYGLNVQMIYNYTNYTTQNPSVPSIQRDIDVYKYSPGIGFGLGFFYKINPSILLGFEINPSINYVFTNGESSSTGYAYKNRDLYFSFTNNGALITLKYRF